jgi:hypothetical protein
MGAQAGPAWPRLRVLAKYMTSAAAKRFPTVERQTAGSSGLFVEVNQEVAVGVVFGQPFQDSLGGVD